MKPKQKLRLSRSKKVVGRLNPTELYTTEGCMRFAGLGEVSLFAARQSGMVKPVYHGNRAYYLGAQLIAWLIKTGKETSEKTRAMVQTRKGMK